MKNPSARFSAFFLLLACLLIDPVIAQQPTGFLSVYGNRTEVGAGLGFGKFQTDMYNGTRLSSKNNEMIFMIQTINGIKMQERAFLGLGVGYELWQHGSFVPVFGHLSYDLQKKENTFVASVNLGYAYGTRQATSSYNSGKGGFTAGVGLGYKQKLSAKLKFVYEVFYKYQAIQSTYNNTFYVNDSTTHTSTVDYSLANHFIGFRIGIVY